MAKFSLWFIGAGMAVISLTSMVGCSSATPRTAAAARAMVVAYCSVPEWHRQLRRIIINSELPPGHRIQLFCPGDSVGDSVGDSEG